jgi:hypothetical protein
MTDRPFRFAVQATPQDGPQWLATARRAEDLGYATLMMADELLRRRDEIGVSYVSVNTAFCEQFAPVVELLAGG